MSWDKTYSFTLAIAADVLTASILWNRRDVTVSSLCGLQLRRIANQEGGIWILVQLGRLLNKIQANHCELAIQGDLAEARETIQFLQPPPSV